MESVRLNGGVEWVTKWMKRNPDIGIPMYMRAMVPRPVEDTKDTEVTHIHVHRTLIESPQPAPVRQIMAEPPPPNSQKKTYDRLHPLSKWGECLPTVYEDGKLISEAQVVTPLQELRRLRIK